ncbi:PAS domain-containing protein [Methylocystis sp. MJC1]|uniref:hybrid sensor histidine kinase/response regulator n=1 Tax=Methylocystis sp. MJC1 TaxID=2654282 RepID=UPI0013EA02F1|nr:ATP-binding protein [Methylocystis sp. MJC1]KAF2989192.1 Autoinducer 2 sensor kinase/phosphatase LuxQ [Methylocystis sp. MJC1]MBU6526921.1 PAS domain-containing protein [Methylocystis sp. MJC1]UZX13357.1 PAS domain-containing protein [Methylocystis sp. MJC1]
MNQDAEKRATTRALDYAVAVLTVAVAAAVRFRLGHSFDAQPLSPFFLAVLFTAGVSGSGPALLATGLSMAVAAFFFMEPLGSFGVALPSDHLRLAVFAVMGIGIAALTEAKARARKGEIEAQIQLTRAQANELAQAARRESATLLGGILNSVPHQIAVIDQAGVILAVNEPWNRFAGENGFAPSGTFSGANYLDAIRGAAAAGDFYASKALDGLQALLAGERRAFAMEYPCQTPGGELWFVMNAARADSGDAAVVVSHTDITERKRAEEGLRESEERFASFMHHLPGLAWIKDVEGRYIYANDAALRVFRVPPEKLYGKRDAEFFDTDTALQFHFHDNEALKSKTGIVAIETLKEADGVIHHFLVSKFAIQDSEGVIKGTGGVAINVTEREEAEKRLREATEKLRAADAHKDEFLATLAHELRNPLAPIGNAVHVLRHDALAHSTKRDRDASLLSMVERQVAHLVRLVDDLLEVSRVTSGKIELKKQRVDLADIMRQAIDMSRPVIERGGHVFSASFPELPLFVEGDPVRLTQVFANLLNNAAKYTEHGGRITLTAEPLGSEARIVVQDNGVGIPSEMLPRVFDLFTQIDRTLGRAQGGLGIGLALVKHLILLHGGSIEARSDGLGQGSAFVVRLPALQTLDVREREQGPSLTTMRTSLRILVIDDDHDVADSQQALLEASGATVRVAYSGAAGVEAMPIFKPDLILLDLGMPEMDGYETAQRIRALPEGRRVKLVALTGWGREQVFQRARDAGFDLQITKPASLEALKEAIEGVECLAQRG